jgi:CBS domain-containing protein
MTKEPKVPEGNESYLEKEPGWSSPAFDASVLEKRLEILPTRNPLVFSRSASVRDAMQGMQRERRGCVLITEDGTARTRLIGIFTERDILCRIVDHGRNPAVLPLDEVMTRDPESVPREASVAWVLNQMAIGGFRHIPVVDESGCPVFVVSVRDVVQLLVEFFPQEILNLPPEWENRAKQREGA